MPRQTARMPSLPVQQPVMSFSTDPRYESTPHPHSENTSALSPSHFPAVPGFASLSKPTVSLVIGDSHSIGVPLAVAVDHSFIVPTGTMMVHPVRMTGMVIGAVQTYDYFEMIQDRILSFVSGHSQISYERLRSLMLNTEMMTKDLGTVLVGGEAVQEGLIDECGGIREALAWLNRAIDGKKQEIDAHDRMTKTDFSENLKRK